MKKQGRPSKMQPWHIDAVYMYAANGLLDEQIAEKLHVSFKTFENWKRTNPMLFEALMLGKEAVDKLVEGTMLREAKGYTVDEKEYEIIKGKKVLKKVTEKFYRGSDNMRKFWMSRRCPGKWGYIEKEKDQGKPIINLTITPLVRNDEKAES